MTLNAGFYIRILPRSCPFQSDCDQRNRAINARYEAFTAVTFQVEVFWHVTRCVAASILHPEDGGSTVLRNVGILPQQYTTPQPRRPRLDK